MAPMAPRPTFPRATPGWTIARPFGIALRIHPSWLLSIAVLSVMSYEWFVQRPGQTVAAGHIALSVALGLAIVSCIVVHELAHALVAKAYGLPVRGITLFALGGVSQIEAEAATPAVEYTIALAGPLTSIVIAGVCAGIDRLLHPEHAGMWGIMATINLVLAVFNLFPAFPMDGGRILRSAFWAGLHNRSRATRWAGFAGRAIAVGVIASGFGTLIFAGTSGRTHGGWGIYGMILGFFMYNAADTAARIEGNDEPNAAPKGAP